MTELPNFFIISVYKHALSVLISERQIFRLGWPQPFASPEYKE